jgi:hypothetical protein
VGDPNDTKTPWTTSSLAEAAQVDQSRIRQLLLAGKLQGQKLGRDWLIPYEEGQRWLEGRRKGAKDPPG